MPAIQRNLLGVALAAVLVSTSGCVTSTPYQPLSAISPVSGGYTDQRIAEGRYRVTFAGNMLTTRDRVESYLLFRAAELTVEQGYDWFVVVDHEMEHDVERVISPDPSYEARQWPEYNDWRPYWRYRELGNPWRDWDPYHGDPFWTRDVDMRTIERFEATAEIRVGRGSVPPGEDKALAARDVMAHLTPQIKYPED